MAGMEFAHADETQIGQVRMTVGIAHRQRLELREVVTAVEGQYSESFASIARTSATLWRRKAASASTASHVSSGSVTRSATRTAHP
jgi:hypothetical protein